MAIQTKRPPLLLQEGRFYEDRDGVIVGPMIAGPFRPGDQWEFHANSGGSLPRSYMSDGSFWPGRKPESPCDLIKAIPGMPVPPIANEVHKLTRTYITTQETVDALKLVINHIVNAVEFNGFVSYQGSDKHVKVFVRDENLDEFKKAIKHLKGQEL